MTTKEALYGKGHVHEIERGKKYRIEFSCGKDPATGKYKRVQETFIGTKRQAEIRCAEIRSEQQEIREKELSRVEHAGMTDADTYAELSDRFITNRIATGYRGRPYSKGTIQSMRNAERHIVSHIGNFPISSITDIVIEELYSTMRNEGAGENTLSKVHKQLKQVFGYAVHIGIINSNPCDQVDKNAIPREPKGKRKALGRDEAKKVFRACTEGDMNGKKVAVFLALATGLRLGECLGLSWSNVNLEAAPPFLNVVEQHTKYGELAAPKTDSSVRNIPFDPLTCDVLRNWKDSQRAKLQSLGIEQTASTPVCTNEKGGFNGNSSFEHWWRRWCVKNGFGRWETQDGTPIVELPVGTPAGFGIVGEYHDSEGWPCDVEGKRYSRSYPRPKYKRHYSGLVFHELRHTHFTHRVAQGTDFETAKELGGWSTKNMLLDVYAHPDGEKLLESANFMTKLLAE